MTSQFSISDWIGCPKLDFRAPEISRKIVLGKLNKAFLDCSCSSLKLPKTLNPFLHSTSKIRDPNFG